MEGGHPGRTGQSVMSAVGEEFRSGHGHALTPLRLMEGLSVKECLFRRAPAPLLAQVRDAEQLCDEMARSEWLSVYNSVSLI